MLKQVMRYSFIYIKKVIFTILIVYAIYIIGIKSYKFFYDFIKQTPIQNQVVKDVEVVIPKGSKTQHIAKILKEKHLIKSKYTFLFRVKFLSSNTEQNLRYGKFVLNTSQTEEDIIKILSSGGEQKESLKITIPEGFSVIQIANKLNSEKICKQKDFIDAMQKINFDYKIINEIPKDKNMRLQGYLFPDTYEIYRDVTAKDVISTMLATFNKKFKDEYYDRAKELGFSVHEIITVASLIEKEAKLPEERSKIAGVIYNRLKKKMPLQIDASILYIIYNGDYKPKRLFYTDYEIDSPYNTYKNVGFPYGPICNPGEESIKAALYPEKHDYLYYSLVDEKTGKHEFTKTLNEHNKLKK